MSGGTVNNSELAHWRALPALHVVEVLADHIEEAPDFTCLTKHSTTHWHVNVGDRDIAFVSYLIEHYAVRKPLGRTQQKFSARAVEKLTSYIQANLANDLSIVELAGIVYLSPFHSSRILKRR